MARDAKGRFAKSQPSIFRWDIVAVLTIVVIAITLFCYVIPQWVSDIQKKSHDDGYSEGYTAGITLGIKNGQEFERNWEVCNWSNGWYYFRDVPYCEKSNPRHVMHFDSYYNKGFDYMSPDWGNDTFVAV